MPDKNTIKDELEQLQLEEARAKAEDRRNIRTQRQTRTAAVELSLKSNRERQRDIQSRCVHRKGGKGVGMLYQGNDSNYAVVKHTFSHGPTVVFCQRCGKPWEKPEPLKKGATAEQKAEYRQQLIDYQWALNLPTDNEPSGTVLFAFSEEPAA